MTLSRRFVCLTLYLGALLVPRCALATPPPVIEEIIRLGVVIAKRSSDSTYDHVFIFRPFRVFYTQGGESTSPENLRDTNGNSVPDYIEEVVEKLATSRYLLNERVQLTDPLFSGRFHARGAEFIDILIKDIPRQYGIASGQVYDDRPSLLEGTPFQGKSLRITLHRALIPATGTPLHELFHLYQFNYSEFNNPWFSEGLARWSESLLTATSVKEQKLPSNLDEVEHLLGKAHNAGLFWTRLSRLCDSRDTFAVIQTQGNDAGLISNIPPGTSLIKKVLENTSRKYNLLQKKVATSPRDVPSYWPRSERRAPENNRYLLQAIGEALDECSARENQELSDFVQAISQYGNHPPNGVENPVRAR